jgi:microcystin degradation protein MlrC
MLEKLLAANVPSAVYASILDAEAVAACVSAGTGATVELSLGGKLDTIHCQPLTVHGTVLTLAEPEPGNRHVVLLVDNIKVILTERRTAFTTVAQFTQLGIDPLEHKITCVKLGYLFPELREIASKAIMALSPGVVNAVIEDLPFEHIQRPMYPLDPDMESQP